MLQHYYALKQNTLFSGFDDGLIKQALETLGAYVKSFRKGDIIRLHQAPVSEIGIVTEGFVYLSKIDFNGNRVILGEVTSGKCFGESLAISGDVASPVIVTAATICSVVFLPIDGIMRCESIPDNFHSTHCKIAQNLFRLLGEKLLTLQIKNDILAQKTIRDKLLLYFEYESKTAGSKSFNIHYSRSELSDFLSLNTSAMSRELGKMRNEGILTFKKNRFVLKSVEVKNE